MTPAPISVERFDKYQLMRQEVSPCAEFVPAEAYDALLQQLAEKDEALRVADMFQQLFIGEGAWERFQELTKRAEAAERAREEAISRFADAYDAGFMASSEGYNGEYGPDTDSANYKSNRDEWLAAFLAASGGNADD